MYINLHNNLIKMGYTLMINYWTLDKGLHVHLSSGACCVLLNLIDLYIHTIITSSPNGKYSSVLNIFNRLSNVGDT